MSQADLAVLLGWGEVTITRYETKSIQDETYDQLIRMVKDDPYYALERLKKQRDHFTSEKYEVLSAANKNRIDSIGIEQMNLKTIENRYAEYDVYHVGTFNYIITCNERYVVICLSIVATRYATKIRSSSNVCRNLTRDA